MILQDHRLAPTPADLAQAEQSILASTGGASAVWCGRAATALHWAYRLATHAGEALETPEVIIPAISCATPATCALSAGCRVRFADVDPATGMATLDTVRERWTPATRAVVFIHLYGQTADLTALAEWCRAHGLTLIEDVAQSQGAVYPDGRAAGSAGDVVVYSFNRTKILDCGGGVLVLRSARMAEAWLEIGHREASSPEIGPQTAAVLALSQRNLYHSLVALRRLRSAADVSAPFVSVNDAYSRLYVRSLRHSAALAEAWETLPRVLEDRFSKAELYSAGLTGGPWRLLDGWRTSGVCWRYSLLVDFPERLESFTESVRRDGFYVSNLYWPLNELINPGDRCPKAEDFARRVVNLWVDGSVEAPWIERCTASLWMHSASRAART